MKRAFFWLKIAGLISLIFLILVFILQNMSPVKFQFFGLSADIPLTALMLVTLFAGFLLGLVFMGLVSRKSASKVFSKKATSSEQKK